MSECTQKELIITINGEERHDKIDQDMTLLDYLRDYLGLTGTKRACNCAECGACTVLLDGRAVYSCSLLALQAYGKAVTTVEGLAEPGLLHPIQEAFIEAGAIHCGFCTTGFEMAVADLLAHNHHPSEQDIREGIAGNLCRCTGYVQVVDAVQRAAKKIYG